MDKAVFLHAGQDIGHRGTTNPELLLNIPLVDCLIHMAMQIQDDKAVHGRHFIHALTAQCQLHIPLQHIVQLTDAVPHMKLTVPPVHVPPFRASIVHVQTVLV